MRRPVIAFAALALGLLPLAARAQATQDRYGPSDQATPPAGGAALRGAQRAASTTLLSWTGKTDGLRGPEGDSDRLRGTAPLNTATGLAVRSANAGRISSASARPAPQRLASAAPSTLQGRKLPSSLYDPGYADAAPTPRPAQPVQQGQPPAPAQATQNPPAAQAAAQPQGQTQGQTQAQQASASAPEGAHYYSLHREYGLTPDPIPAADPSVLALSPTVAQAMASNPDDGPSIDLAGQDQANVAPPPRQYNQGSSSTSSTSSSSSQTTTYTVKQ